MIIRHWNDINDTLNSVITFALIFAGLPVYFLFFALMPWYTVRDRTKPVPERLR